jgi:hypothetical protein
MAKTYSEQGSKRSSSVSQPKYTPPPLNKELRAAVHRGDFDFLLPFQKPLWRTDEVAEVIGRSIQYVRALIEAGRLEAHQDSAFGDRKSNLITRRSVLLYLAETANYDPGYLVIRIEVLIKRLPAPALDRLVATARKLRERVS